MRRWIFHPSRRTLIKTRRVACASSRKRRGNSLKIKITLERENARHISTRVVYSLHPTSLYLLLATLLWRISFSPCRRLIKPTVQTEQLNWPSFNFLGNQCAPEQSSNLSRMNMLWVVGRWIADYSFEW